MPNEQEDRFIGRTDELKTLKAVYDSPEFQMVVIYGRRRIGKTTLINHFLSSINSRFISFVSTEMSEEALLKRMGADVLDSISPDLKDKLVFESFEAIFDFIGNAAKTDRLVFVID